MASRVTSQKHKDFVREPMKNKPIGALPGLGSISGAFDGSSSMSGAFYGERLVSKGITRAKHLLGQFLLMDRDTEIFISWLQHTIYCGYGTAFVIADCLDEWCLTNL